MVVGVTGGIASGKTTVAQMLADLGAGVIMDADQIGRTVVERDPALLNQLVQSFGQGIITLEGTLDRRKLGRMAFSSGAARDTLNAIVHPPLLRELTAQVDRAAMACPKRPIIIDAALLSEWMLHPTSRHLLPHIDIVVVVTAHEATQIARLRAKGFTREEARQRIQAQLTPDQRLTRADYVLHNEGSLASLTRKVHKLWNQIRTQPQHILLGD